MRAGLSRTLILQGLLAAFLILQDLFALCGLLRDARRTVLAGRVGCFSDLSSISSLTGWNNSTAWGKRRGLLGLDGRGLDEGRWLYIAARQAREQAYQFGLATRFSFQEDTLDLRTNGFPSDPD